MEKEWEKDVSGEGMEGEIKLEPQKEAILRVTCEIGFQTLLFPSICMKTSVTCRFMCTIEMGSLIKYQ